MTTKLMVVEDHEIVSQALRDMLGMEQDLEVVASAESVEEAEELLESEHIDVILMDVRLKGEHSGIDATRALKGRLNGIKIIVLTMFTDPATVTEAIKAGADAYVSKGSSKELLVRTIKDVAAGRAVLDPSVTEGVFEQLGGRETAGLTPRETTVLQQLSDGETTRDVARNMFVSEETVKSYLKQIFKKLGVRDRTEAVAEAFRRGLIH